MDRPSKSSPTLSPGDHHRHGHIATNPPFHDPRGADVGLGRAFLAAAADALRPGGRLVLVANRTLPYERDLARRFAGVATLAERDGFKVIEARRQSVPG